LAAANNMLLSCSLQPAAAADKLLLLLPTSC
jgi:hypothetical protein